MGESTRRSSGLDAEHLTAILRQQGVEELAGSEELTLVLDGMELRREGATAQEHLMQVKDLDGALVNGYRSFNVLGIGTEHKRGLLYHDLSSSQAPDFKSENTEIEQALAATEASVQHLDVPKTWVLDRGFDNDAHWWWVWDHTSSHLVWRVKHTGRIVLWCTPQGVWEERYLENRLAYAQPLATVETELEVCLRGQKRAKRQTVTVELAAVPLRVYAPEAAGKKGAQRRTKDVWLVKVAVRNAVTEPWLHLTDWPVTDEASIVRIFRFYRLRWAVEERFAVWVETTFRVERGQVIAIDGKTVRGAGLRALHLVSAWAHRSGIVLGQQKVDDKSNEITAIPQLLEDLYFAGSIVTLDAMGTQTKIAQKIMDKQADYVLALKGNQGQLHADVADWFAWATERKFRDVPHTFAHTVNKNHGRIDIRQCWAFSDARAFEAIRHYDGWAGLLSVAMVKRERRPLDNSPSTLETAFFLGLPSFKWNER